MLLDMTADDRTLYTIAVYMRQSKILSIYCRSLLDMLLYYDDELTFESCKTQ